MLRDDMVDRRAASRSSLERLVVGSFLAPDDYAAGQRVVVCAWIVRHPELTLLVDTGIAADLPPEDVRRLRFSRTPILHALHAHGLEPASIDAVVNCHLHADHAGGNGQLRGTPIYAQAAEIEAARAPGYSVASAVDLAQGHYVSLDGEAELAPGLRIMPTPGHSPGHQALAVETGRGLVVLAGQAFRGASLFGMALHALDLAAQGYPDPPPTPEWLPRLVALRPQRVLFAHDLAIWDRDG